MLLPALLLLAVAVSPAPTFAKAKRSTVERHAFVKAVACPATDRHRLPCPGYQIDHITPLCAGGADHRNNMQWLTIEDHKAKTRGDVKSCKVLMKVPTREIQRGGQP